MPSSEPLGDPRTLTLIAVGGALGTAARYELSLAAPVATGAFPNVTLLINVAGAFVLGVLLGSVARRAPQDQILRPLLGVGVLGGFTTFSTFSIETVQLARHGHAELAAVYVVASITLGLVAARTGERLAHAEPRFIAEDET